MLAGGLQLSPQLPVVIDLAVVDDQACAIRGRHGLGTAGDVDDAEPPMGQPARPVDLNAVRVRAATMQNAGHGIEDGPLRPGLEIHITRNPAHGRPHPHAEAKSKGSLTGIPREPRT